MANKLKEPVVEEQKAEKPAAEKPRSIKGNKNFSRFMNMYGIFSRNQVVHSMPFILFVTVLIIAYIGNSYYAERMIREIDKTKTDLKDKRAEYISIMSRMMYQSNQSEVARALQSSEVKESTEPPGKIFIAETPKK